MSGLTNRILYTNTGGTVMEGDDIISLYFSGTSLINFIQNDSNWSGITVTNSGLTAYTLYEGQKYIDNDYFYVIC